MIHPTAKIHPLAFIHESADIGENVIVWQFASILKNVVLEKGVSIGAGTEIGSGTTIGRDSRISAQVFLPSNSVIGERVFVGPRCVMTDDRHPRVGNFHYTAEPPTLESGCSVGAGSVILPGIRIGFGALVGAGSVVTKDVNPHEHVRGEPARIKAYSKVKTETNFDIYSPELRGRIGV